MHSPVPAPAPGDYAPSPELRALLDGLPDCIAAVQDSPPAQLKKKSGGGGKSSSKYSDFFLLPTAVFNKVRETNEAMGKLVHEYSQKRARQKALEKAAQPRRVLGRSATKRWRTLGGGAHPQQSV